MYSSNGYAARAEECVRLANLTTDRMVQADLLRLRQTYLMVASRLAQVADAGERDPVARGPDKPGPDR
jgi:hypothetical protein